MSIDIVLLAVANALSYKHSYCLDAYVARSLTLGIRIGFILNRNMEYSNTENNADMTAVDSFIPASSFLLPKNCLELHE